MPFSEGLKLSDKINVPWKDSVPSPINGYPALNNKIYSYILGVFNSFIATYTATDIIKAKTTYDLILDACWSMCRIVILQYTYPKAGSTTFRNITKIKNYTKVYIGLANKQFFTRDEYASFCPMSNYPTISKGKII